jgi:hemerythrin
MTQDIAPLNWSDSFRLGIEDIDSQHQMFFAVVNDFIGASNRGADRRLVEKMLVVVQGYALSHFEHEEGVMIAANYPDYAKHRKQHSDLLLSINEFRNRFINGEDVTGHLAIFLRDWLADHVMKVDQQLGIFLAACGQSHSFER